jgi:hypothetical protein
MDNVRDIFDRFRKWVGRKEPQIGVLSEPSLVILGRAIQTTRADEYDCDQTNQLLDQFAEAIVRGADPEPWMNLIQAHLERCPDCRAEYEALLHILETEAQ